MSFVEEETRPVQDVEAKDGHVAVFLAEDRMSAAVTVTPPLGDGQPVTAEDVLTKLQDAGVIFGIDAGAVARAVEAASAQADAGYLPERVVVARGKPPVDGEDARIDLHLSLTETGGKPRVREDGSVDMLDLNLVHNVTLGTVLATHTPATPGEPGISVKGAEIRPHSGRPGRLTAGKGAHLSDDHLTVTAAVDGHPTLFGTEVVVTDLYQIKEDVGVATGNVQFVGSVLVKGGIKHGFKVRAEGDVEVQGTIDGGTVEAAGNVTVRYGITGGGRVTAGGSVRARFIESADVSAGTDVWAADGILQSRVEAGGSIEVLGRRGAIIGGRIVARTTVSARVLGSVMGAATEILVGLSPSGLNAFSLGLKHEAADIRASSVQARESCQPGVVVGVGNARYRVTDAHGRARFRLNEESEIEVIAG